MRANSLSLAEILAVLTPSRMTQVTSKLGLAVDPMASPQSVALLAEEMPLRPVLEQLYRGELQKLCDHVGVDRAGAVYDKDLIEKLLSGR